MSSDDEHSDSVGKRREICETEGKRNRVEGKFGRVKESGVGVGSGK